jgi:C-terminal processing protease CtpA/Prc
MVVLISSYLFDGEPVHLNSLYWRNEDFTEQYWTLPFVPGERLADAPVYVLTSKDTFSAGEEFAYNLQTRQRATLVGETTAGGAHPGSPHRLHPHFEAFIPGGRAINPVTNDNWEGRGVAPDVPVPSEEALEAAYKLALDAVIESLGDPAHGPLKQLLEEAEAARSAK